MNPLIINILSLVFISVNIAFSIVFLVPIILHIASILTTKKKSPSSYTNRKYNFALLIPTYKNVNIARPLILSLLEQQYESFHIFLIADNTLETLNIESEKLTVFYPETALHSKIKSIHKGLELIETSNSFSHITILDEDNLVTSNYLLQVSKRLNEGFLVIQTERIAKNTDSYIANVDAGLETYHNFVDKELPFKLVNSTLLSGSGMVLEINLFRELIHDILQDNPTRTIYLGEDKMIQARLHNKNIDICYASEIKTLDEKVTKTSILKNQRTRWYATYVENLPNAWRLFRTGLYTRDRRSFLLGLIVIYPPLTPLLIFGAIWVLIGSLFLQPAFLLVAISLSLFIVHFFIVLYKKQTPWKVIRSFWIAPLFMSTQILSLINMKKTRNDFLYTQKIKTTEEANKPNKRPETH